MDVKRVEDQIIALKLVVERDTFNVISAYTPYIGLAKHLKVKIWADFEGLLHDIPHEDVLTTCYLLGV